jgi:hypothetical protein
MPLKVDVALANFEMASTVSCWNSVVVVALDVWYPAPMSVFFIRWYVLCARVGHAFSLIQLFSERGRPFHVALALSKTPLLKR